MKTEWLRLAVMMRAFAEWRKQVTGLPTGQLPAGLQGCLERLPGKHKTELEAVTTFAQTGQMADEASQDLLREAYSLAIQGETGPPATMRLRPALSLPGNSAEYGATMPFQSLQLNVDNLPLPSPAHESVQGAGADWLSEFEKECRCLPAGSVHSLAESLLYLLQKHASNVHAGAGLPVGLSLYEYHKSAMAMVSCLAPQREQQEKKILLLSGDLSGIQEFIYDLVSKNAAKLLKGRSFYLQLIAESALGLLLQETGSSRSQVVVSSGGGFLLLLPGTQTEAVQILSRELMRSVNAKHGPKLSLSLSAVQFSHQELKADGAGKWLSLLEERQSRKKKTRMASEMAGDSVLFTPSGQGALTVLDDITNEEITGDLREYGSTKTVVVSQDTFQQLELGRNLRKASWWVQGRQSLPGNSLQQLEVAGLGWHHYFLDDKQMEELKSIPEGMLVWRMNGDEAGCIRLWEGGATRAAVSGFVFYGGLRYPVDAGGETRLPEQLAGEPDSGFRRVGVLRMDVDDLGSLIRSTVQSGGFWRLSAVSAALDWFFKGHLNEIIKQTPFRDNIQIIYSGGDDLFIYGHWEAVVKLAPEIQRSFSRWSGGNDAMHLSGGVVLVTEKYPIIRAALEAGKAEDEAKDHQGAGGDEVIRKKSFTFLGMPFHFDHEWRAVEQYYAGLLQVLKDGQVNQSLISKIKANYESYKASLRDKPEELPQGKIKTEAKENPYAWRWNFAYTLGRMAASTDKDSPAQALMNLLKQQAFEDRWEGLGAARSRYKTIELIYAASRWAEFSLRGER